ncbi:MAG: nucleotide exchange factor GrpE [Acidobacteria bacterium 13_1_20CM_3_53_8]|nr:MAG: nucleotide exchange factor GrpE [Acidobacteria bacterium 13_1_20CM_3_53_8]
MQEDKVAREEEVRAQEPAAEEIRVTDRRRINLDGLNDEGKDESGASADAPSLKPSYVEELEARTRAAEQKVADVQSRFEQLRAQLQRETDETRQRLNRAAEERARRERADFIATLLPVADNLQRAVQAAEQSSSFDPLLNGVRGTLSQFESALVAAGVEPVVSVGAKFNPELHEAVDTIEVAPERDGTVTAEYSRGYKIGDRLLRPARVQVGRARAGAAKAVISDE